MGKEHHHSFVHRGPDPTEHTGFFTTGAMEEWGNGQFSFPVESTESLYRDKVQTTYRVSVYLDMVFSYFIKLRGGRKPENREETHTDMTVNDLGCLGLITITCYVLWKSCFFMIEKWLILVLKHQHQLSEVITRHGMPCYSLNIPSTSWCYLNN